MKTEDSVVTDINSRKCTLAEVYAGTNFKQLIPLPELSFCPGTIRACEELYELFVDGGSGACIPKSALKVPAWVFLEFLVKHKDILLHGSSNLNIETFEPRAASDNIVDGHKPRIYAASSGVMPIFYAVLDRKRLSELPYVSAMNVSYTQYVDDDGRTREGFHFAIDYRALPYRPWRDGAIYILPRATFTSDHEGMQWFSETPVRPLAKLQVSPQDFPLLAKVRGIDWHEVQRHTSEGMNGFPWLEDSRLYPVLP